MTQAALGGRSRCRRIDGGRARVTIPAGTQTGDQFRLRGKGMSVLRSAARGDMYIQVAVETPQNLTPSSASCSRSSRRRPPRAEASPESEGFFAKVKEFWDGLGR